MTTGPRAPDDRQGGNEQPAAAGVLSVPGDDRVEDRSARLAVLRALALRRFRDYAVRISGPERHRGEDR